MEDQGNQPVALPSWMERGNIPLKSTKPSPRRDTALWKAFAAGLTVPSLIAAGFLIGRNNHAKSVVIAATAPAVATTASTAAASTTVSSAAPATVLVTTTSVTSVVATTAPTTLPATTVAKSVAPRTSPPTTVSPPATAAPVTVPIEQLQPRSALFSGGKVYLRGSVPTQAMADNLIIKVGKVVGAANVVVEYVVDSRAPAPNEAVLNVADTVLFASDSSDLAPDFVPILNLGLALMQQNPKVTIDVIGHTDALGTPASNATLAARRCESVIGYMVAAGIDRSRLVAIPVGETAPVADNADPAGRRLNRRAEFVIHGLLQD